MTIQEYSQKALSTAIYGEGDRIIYPTLGINGEAGEIAEKVKKILRDKNGVYSTETKLELLKEVGDVLWYVNALCRDLGYTLETAAMLNLEKLESRRQRNMIQGNGDNR
jgi:NTP pyrophosphatase (non-canonical NTP hydrolase)